MIFLTSPIKTWAEALPRNCGSKARRFYRFSGSGKVYFFQLLPWLECACVLVVTPLVSIKGILWWARVARAREVSKTLGQGPDIANYEAYRCLQMQCNPIFCLMFLFVRCSCCILTVVNWLIHFVNCEVWNHPSIRVRSLFKRDCLLTHWRLTVFPAPTP